MLLAVVMNDDFIRLYQPLFFWFDCRLEINVLSDLRISAILLENMRKLYRNYDNFRCYKLGRFYYKHKGTTRNFSWQGEVS